MHFVTLWVTVTFNFLTKYWFIDGRGIVIYYPYAKFDDFGLSRFDFILWTNRHADRITDADDLYTDATTVGISNSGFIDMAAILP